jgi:membrane protease subunit HflK
VQQAVDDTQKSRNDHDRYILEADTYAQGLIPIARGEAARILQDAEAYRDRVIAKAEGDVARFEAVLAEYQRAPRVTRERMYIDALQEVYGNTNKVILDAEGSGNLLYLPIDKLATASSRRSLVGTVDDSFEVRMPAETTETTEDPELARERRTRE